MNYKNKNKFVMILCILCVSLTFQFTMIKSSLAFSSTGAKVNYVVNGIPKQGNTITINVNVANANQLYGASLDFLYDTSSLEVLSIEKGNLFTSPSIVVPVKQIKNGQANIAISLTGSETPITGNGSLFIIKAKVLNKGILNLNTTSSNSNLSLNGSTCRIKLSNNKSEKINYTASNASVNLIAGPNEPSINTNIQSPQPTNSTIRVSAGATGDGNLSYRFWVTNGTSRNIVQDYSSQSYLDWKPSKPGVYRISVDIKDASGNYATEEIVYTIKR